MHAGIPSSVPAYGVNMLCGSGLKAVVLGYQAVSSDRTAVVIAGGQESMSQVRVTESIPHAQNIFNCTSHKLVILIAIPLSICFRK